MSKFINGSKSDSDIKLFKLKLQFFYICYISHSPPVCIAKTKLSFSTTNLVIYPKPLPRPVPLQRPISQFRRPSPTSNKKPKKEHQYLAHTTDQDQDHPYHLLTIPKVHLK